MTRYEQQFYDQFRGFAQDFAKSVKLREKALQLQDDQNNILTGIYLRLAPKPKDPQEEPSQPLTGIPQIDAVLAKQKAKL